MSPLFKSFRTRKEFISFAVTCMIHDAVDRGRKRPLRVQLDREELPEGTDGPLLGDLYAALELYLAELRLRSKELSQAVDIFWHCFCCGIREIHDAVNDGFRDSAKQSGPGSPPDSAIHDAVNEGFCEVELEFPDRIDETNFIEVAVRRGMSKTVAYERYNLLKSKLYAELKENPVIGKAILFRERREP